MLLAKISRAVAVVVAIAGLLGVAYALTVYILWALEGRRGRNYFAGLADAQSSAPVLRQFCNLFPKAQVTYTCFDGSDAPGFDAHVNLHGRYELTMQLPAIFDAAGRHVIGYGEPKFYLLEVGSVQLLPDGRSSTSYNAAGQRTFWPKEWEQIVARHGDFEAIGYTMKLDQPIAGFP
jgi:hypothetical protein